MEERLEEIAKTNRMLMELLEQRGIDVFRWWRFALWGAAGVTWACFTANASVCK